MTKAVLVFLGVFLLSACQAVLSETVGAGGKFVLPLSSSIRSLSLQAMAGKWYEAASSRQVRKIFQKDCQCLSSTFTMIQNDKLHIMNECLNKTTNHIVVVNGTLHQVMAESFPGAFCMEFESESKTGASVLDAQSEAKKEATKLKEGGVKDAKEGIKLKDEKKEAGVKDAKEGGVKTSDKKQSKEREETSSKKEELARVVKEKNINFLVLKNVDNKALLISGPTSELIWVLSRTPTLDDSILSKFNDKAKRLGFEPLVKEESCPEKATAHH